MLASLEAAPPQPALPTLPMLAHCHPPCCTSSQHPEFWTGCHSYAAARGADGDEGPQWVPLHVGCCFCVGLIGILACVLSLLPSSTAHVEV